MAEIRKVILGDVDVGALQMEVESLRDARAECESRVCAEHTYRDLAEGEVESLREQLEAMTDAYDDAEASVKEAEAKLAEDAHRNDQLKRERDKYRAKLAEEKELRAGTEAAWQDYDKWLDAALDALGVETVFEIKGAKDRLAELAAHERWIDSYGHPEEWVKRAQAAHNRAENLEAKLAEVEKERDAAEKGRDYYSAKNAERWSSMDQARELAERQVPIARKEAEWTREATWSDAAIAFDKIARLLGGDDEPK